MMYAARSRRAPIATYPYPNLHEDAEASSHSARSCPIAGNLHHNPRTMSATQDKDSGRTSYANRAEPAPDGPLCLTGRIQVEVAGRVVADTDETALCRCGHSRNKPFCDGSHRTAGFRDNGLFTGGRLVAVGDPVEGSEPVRIICRPDGPLSVMGPLEVAASDGETIRGNKGSLCRCGVSSNRPFCDGSHRHTDFRAE